MARPESSGVEGAYPKQEFARVPSSWFITTRNLIYAVYPSEDLNVVGINTRANGDNIIPAPRKRSSSISPPYEGRSGVYRHFGRYTGVYNNNNNRNA
jgi:hypothetical protein